MLKQGDNFEEAEQSGGYISGVYAHRQIYICSRFDLSEDVRK